MSRVEFLGVVVPALDEEELLPSCLAALEAAVRAPELLGIEVEVLVVADGCTDGTVGVAQQAGVAVLADDAGGSNVGAARHRGVQRLLADADRARVPADRVWVATTDADSRVPKDWLVLQVTAARSGADALVGTVEIDDWTGVPASAGAAFTADYDAWRAGGPGAVHPHVHGANLGVRGSAYLQVGGFPPLAAHEDRGLVDALVRGGWNVLRAPAGPVRTSPRRVSRAPAGLGADLARRVAQSVGG